MSIVVEDASGFHGEAELTFTPSTEAEVLVILREAAASKTPVTVNGALTGVTGGGVPHRGWVISLKRLTRCTIHQSRAICGPGVSLRSLNSAASATGQFYAPDPTEWTASVGGSIATNASGSRSFHYGDTRRYIERLRFALVDGSVRDVRRGDAIPFSVPAIPLPATTKSTAGYRLAPGMDWIDLICGSEGTLGIVIEAEVRLLPATAELLSGVVFFRDEDSALDAVDAWRTLPALRMIEYFDAASLDLLRPAFAGIPGAARAALLIEDEPNVDEWLGRLAAAGALADESWFGETALERERFRRFRHALPERVNDQVRRNGFLKLGTDYAVPPARNREMMAAYRALLPEGSVVFGHIGDAHVHANILPRTAEENERGAAINLELAREAVRLGGTVSAEHGLGKRKRHLLELQFSAAEIDAMKAVKRRVDPHWLLGRETLFPYEA